MSKFRHDGGGTEQYTDHSAQPTYLYPTALARPLGGSRLYGFAVQGYGHGEGIPHMADGDLVGSEVALPCPALWVSRHAI